MAKEKQIKDHLIELGYDANADTQVNIRQFQKDVALAEVTGIADKKTIEALFSDAAPHIVAGIYSGVAADGPRPIRPIKSAETPRNEADDERVTPEMLRAGWDALEPILVEIRSLEPDLDVVGEVYRAMRSAASRAK